MALSSADLTNVNIAAYNANARYGKDFWTAPSGTGTLMRKQLLNASDGVTELKADVAKLEGDVAELKGMLATALAALPKA